MADQRPVGGEPDVTGDGVPDVTDGEHETSRVGLVPQPVQAVGAPVVAQPGFVQNQLVIPADAAARIVDQLGPKGLTKLYENQHAIGMRQVEFAERQLAADVEIKKAELEDRKHRRQLRSQEKERASQRTHHVAVLLAITFALAVGFSFYTVGGETWKHVSNFVALALAAIGARAYGRHEGQKQAKDEDTDKDETDGR